MSEEDRSTVEARIIADVMEHPPKDRPRVISHYMLAMFADWTEGYNEQDMASALHWFDDKVLKALPEEDRLHFLTSSDDEISRDGIGEIARTEWLNGNSKVLEWMIFCDVTMSAKTKVFVAGIVSGKQKRPHGNRKPAAIRALAEYEAFKDAVLAREVIDAEKRLIRQNDPLETDVDRTAKESIAKRLGIGRGTLEKIISQYANINPKKTKK